jgi:putative transposase
MPDHIHLLMQSKDPRYSLGQVIGSFKHHTTSESWKLGIQGKLWQPRFYDHIVRYYDSGDDIVEYILDNPVRRGLIGDGETYPYCDMPDPL